MANDPIQYGYASEIFPRIQQLLGGLLGSSEQGGLSSEEFARNSQIWDRLGRGASASPSAMGPAMLQPQVQHPAAPHAQAPQAPIFPAGWQNKQLAQMSAVQPNFGRLIPWSQAGIPQGNFPAGLLSGGMFDPNATYSAQNFPDRDATLRG